MSPRKLFVLGALAASLTACDSPPATAPGSLSASAAAGQHASVNRDLAQVRAATARFHDVQVAIAEGYENPGHCVSLPGVGGMGLHFLKLPLVMDAGYSAAEPEVLLYEPQPDGSLRLVGVEYVVVQEAWHGAGHADIPHFGSQPFDVTPAGPDTPAAYTLHAWIWRHNPAGVFVPFNPQVTCPAGGHVH